MSTAPHILVIDDEPGALKVTSTVLRHDGYEVDVCLNAIEALGRLSDVQYDCVLVDFRMPQMDGLEFISTARERGFKSPIIMVTAFGSVKMAVESMKRGAYNYLTKPVNFDELRVLVRQAVEKTHSDQDLERLRKEVDQRYSFGSFIGRSQKMQEIRRLSEMVADTDASVLILGETGTGKSLVARAVHHQSRRHSRPFVEVNCAALPANLLESELFGHERGAFTGAVKTREGRFERANGGSIFLDEIGSLPLELQAKLLRVLQESEFEKVGSDRTTKVDVRILAATNLNLEEAVAAKAFREDLFYRLNVVPIRLPPLRERPEDIPVLAKHFLGQFNQSMGRSIESFSPAAMAKMMAYPWPGNVRELENLVERAVVLSTSPEIEDVELASTSAAAPLAAAPYLQSVDFDLPLKDLSQRLLQQLEQDYLSEMLRRYHGNVGLASRQCGITRRSLYEKMKAYGLRKEEFKRSA
ncbi:MAG: sigma-54-dependent Fis family transcriptional regulator [Candidatus Riflebacteria bacterium]|nr:sigma-54-dependent Fis family transcriptional regulator [Candidatus Riflebacteria bacterium]